MDEPNEEDQEEQQEREERLKWIDEKYDDPANWNQG